MEKEPANFFVSPLEIDRYINRKSLILIKTLTIYEKIKFNPYGPYQATLKGARKLRKIIRKRRIEHVCGYNYFMNYNDWNRKLLTLLD